MSVKNQGQSIVKGSLILLIANLMVKIIGAAFKIPLTNLIGNEGMGIFNSAYNIYAGLFIVATAGLPVAVSKMISESTVTGNLIETKRIFKASYMMFLIIGIIGFYALYFFSDSLVRTTKFEGSNSAIKAISPAIFFVSLMSVYRGFFQGTTNMFPTAISEVVEALAKLVVGFTLAYILFPKGLSVSATGAIIGVTTGTFLSFAVLLIIHIIKKNSIYNQLSDTKPARSLNKIVWALLKIAIPVTISASVFTLTNMVDTFMIGRNLDSIKHLLSESPLQLYGKYTSKAVVLYNMPPTLVMSLCLALVPAISRAHTVKNKQLIKSTTTQSLKATLMFAAPCSAWLAVLAAPILKLLYGTDDATLLLQLVSPAVTFVSLVLVSNAILQATGHVSIPVINIAIGGIAKVIINYVLVSNPAININGAPIGTASCYFIYMVLNLTYVYKITKAEIGFSFWIKPIISALVSGAVAYFIFGICDVYFGGMGRIGIIFSLALSGGLSAAAYLLTLLATGGITKEDLSILPKGDKLAEMLIKIKLMK